MDKGYIIKWRIVHTVDDNDNIIGQMITYFSGCENSHRIWSQIKDDAVVFETKSDANIYRKYIECNDNESDQYVTKKVYRKPNIKICRKNTKLYIEYI